MAVVETDYEPVMSKRAGGVIIHQPGPNDCMKHKVCNCTSPPSCIVTGVKKVVADIRVEEAERRGQRSNGHCGGRKRQSAIDKAAIIVDIAHAVWREAYRDGVLMMEIMVAFLSVARGRLIHII
jgi:hypothetical protein